MFTHFYMCSTETKQHNNNKNNGYEEFMCTIVLYYITKGSKENCSFHNIAKVAKLTRNFDTTILSTTKFVQPVGRTLCYPN